MKTLTLALATALLSSTAALAATDISDFDTNGDRFASQAEVTAKFPGFSSADFRKVDANRDQRISATELSDPDARGIVARYETSVGTVTGLAAIDTNGNGFATFDELSVQYPGLTAADFRQIDTNDDRRVSFVELYNPVAQAVVSRHEGSGLNVAAIADLDVDGDNHASFNELLAVYPGLSQIDWNNIDTNSDNRLNFGELYSLETQAVLNRSGS